MNIELLDALTIFTYLIAMVWIGIWYAGRQKATSEGYFLAGKSLGWKVIGASLFASNISTVHLVGLAESGFKDGILWGNFEWFSTVELLILAFVFVPFYLKSKVVTLPEFLEKRYDSRSRMILAIFSILAALFMHIGISFYAGAVVFEEIFGWNIWFSVGLIAVATGVYTIIGGLSSVVLTESLQTIILIFGSILITVLAIVALPGVGIHSLADLKAAVMPDRLHAVDFDASAKGFTFRDMMLSHLILGIWYWCTDQTIVQRILGAKNENQARLGAVFAGFLKILPPFIMILPGILAFALFQEQIGDNTKSVLPVLIMQLLPVGLKGLMVAALLAAVMSSVAAALTSCSTLVVYDVFDRVNPNLSDGKKIQRPDHGRSSTHLGGALVTLFGKSRCHLRADQPDVFHLRPFHRGGVSLWDTFQKRHFAGIFPYSTFGEWDCRLHLSDRKIPDDPGNRKLHLRSRRSRNQLDAADLLLLSGVCGDLLGGQRDWLAACRQRRNRQSESFRKLPLGRWPQRFADGLHGARLFPFLLISR
ncbi:hypothetical protein GCM10009119_22010 [Algoriphagus jejuensis]|uniref:SSS family solute:Na+ symporter n=1 Tax=Algoriphagus jejuensis TaxID=419934 RepID=A0ABN1N0E2_9BACT